MKTLNEVIKAFECCENGEPYSNCEECSYIGIGSCCLERENDALHYLKNMKNLEEDYDILYNKYWREFNQQQANPPLTWEELQQMEGKPIWVEVKYHNPDAIYKYWTIVKYFDSHEGEDLIFTGTGFYHRSLLGTGWQAYRKEHHDDNQ